MTVRHASLLLPCSRIDELPTYLQGREAADLLAGWTALWHPALIAATSTLPGWHPADAAPDPDSLVDELVVVPSASRQRLAGDWCDRFRARAGALPLVESVASRRDLIDAVLKSGSLPADAVDYEVVADFLALGYAHLQVELLTRAMRYTSVLDTDEFTSATVAAARAATADDREQAQAELARAFDLLSDARNHVYAVDFYVVDLTLVVGATLGEALRAKLASGAPTSLLITGELLRQASTEYPETWTALRQSIEAGTACIVGGAYHGGARTSISPEALLRELMAGQEAARELLQREYEVYGQFEGPDSTLLPEVLVGMGFRGALHAAFDGTRLPRADQCKTWWGPQGRAIPALSATPLDVARPETWLRMGERIGDTIARDHVATILLAGWPSSACEYYDDLLRAARFSPVLGRLVTLEEYFRVSREIDEWTTFNPSEYAYRPGIESARMDPQEYRELAVESEYRSALLLARAAGLGGDTADGKQTSSPEHSVVVNPLNIAFPSYVGFDPLRFDDAASSQTGTVISNVPACGYATLAAPADPAPVALADGNLLRNERLELTVSAATGGIQSLRTHRDRSTRLSQRLVYRRANQPDTEATQMVAEQVEITRNDPLVGQITSQGQLLDVSNELISRYVQTVRLVRGLSVAVVDVQIEPVRLPQGDGWQNYYASRIAWAADAVVLRRGVQWASREATKARIESPEWVEVDDGIGTITCFGLGLEFHRRVGETWLDTLLIAPEEQRRRFQFALGIDEQQPTQTALGLMAAGRVVRKELPTPLRSPTGWFVRIGSRNLMPTHIEPLGRPRSGIRLRILETSGQATRTLLTGFRSFLSAQATDFRGEPTGVLSISDGAVEIDIEAYGWIQVEAEW